MSKNEAFNYYNEIYNEVQLGIMQEALAYKKRNVFTWTKLKPLQLKIVWESFMRMGFVLHTKIVDKIQENITENTCMLEIMTSCMGHSQFCGIKEMCEKYELDRYQKRKLRYVFLDRDWGVFSNGQPLLSDYGPKKINEFLLKAIMEEDYGKKLTWLDAILNVCHQRSDLAEVFVEGGSKTLSILSASPSELLKI